ncbi:cytochrome c biogenesis CcdA family protein [Methanosarcina barkeri]
MSCLLASFLFCLLSWQHLQEKQIETLAIVLGVSISFTIMGVATSAFGAVFSAYTNQLKILAEVLILLLGFALLFDISLFNAFSKFPLLGKMGDEGPVSGFLLGLSLGVLWIPCVGPILGSILTMVALKGNTITGALTLSVYSLGFAVPMLLLAYSAYFSSSKIRLISKWDVVFKKRSGNNTGTLRALYDLSESLSMVCLNKSRYRIFEIPGIDTLKYQG